MKTYLFVPILAIFMFMACENQEIGNSKDVNTEAVYQAYNIGCSEGDSAMELLAQFRFGGANGTTLVLTNGSELTLDGGKLKLDSSDYTGAFYQASVPFSAAESKHVLRFQGNNGNIYTNNFSVQPLELLNHFEQPLSPGELVLNFRGCKNSVPIQIAINDTAKETLACDTTFAPKDGKLILPANFMGRLAPGPITIHILQKQTLPLQEATKEGGEINFTYELKQIEAKLDVAKSE